MRLAVVTDAPLSYSTSRIAAVARQASMHVDVVDPAAVTVSAKGEVLAGGSEFAPDVVVPRTGSGAPNCVHALVRMSETGVRVVNDGRAIALSRDKVAAFRALADAGVAQPESIVVAVGGGAPDPVLVSEAVGALGLPVVVKAALGSRGRGVRLCRSEAEALKALVDAGGYADSALVRRFVAEASGVDLRVLVLGGQVLGAIKRVAREGEWRANVALGACAHVADLDAEAAGLTLRAVDAIGLAFCGVDLVRSRGGWLVLETNAAPGFEAFERATGVDVASAIVRFASGGALGA